MKTDQSEDLRCWLLSFSAMVGDRLTAAPSDSERRRVVFTESEAAQLAAASQSQADHLGTLALKRSAKAAKRRTKEQWSKSPTKAKSVKLAGLSRSEHRILRAVLTHLRADPKGPGPGAINYMLRSLPNMMKQFANEFC